MKKKLILFKGPAPTSVEGFSEDSERSCEGALHLHPGQPKDISADEYAYIVAQRPDLKKVIVLLRDSE